LITINEEYECRLPDMYKITAQRAHKAADACAVAVINLIESKQLNVEQTNFIINP
jgi:hypothetical protein